MISFTMLRFSALAAGPLRQLQHLHSGGHVAWSNSGFGCSYYKSKYLRTTRMGFIFRMLPASRRNPITNLPVLIPAYDPEIVLISVVEALIDLGFQSIIVVDDGSAPQFRPIFERLEGIRQCHVLHHTVNMGKGRALKTGLNHTYLRFPNAAGVVTVDADGQHLPQDVFRVAQTFLENLDSLVIGVRRLGMGIPLRSLLGNTIMKYMFRFLVGKKISDTQSGLRCIPMRMVADMLRLEGERYEYELNMLISTRASRTDIVETEISTVYLDGNRSSHFNPLLDSIKIYFLLLRFAMSSRHLPAFSISSYLPSCSRRPPAS